MRMNPLMLASKNNWNIFNFVDVTILSSVNSSWREHSDEAHTAFFQVDYPSSTNPTYFYYTHHSEGSPYSWSIEWCGGQDDGNAIDVTSLGVFKWQKCPVDLSKYNYCLGLGLDEGRKKLWEETIPKLGENLLTGQLGPGDARYVRLENGKIWNDVIEAHYPMQKIGPDPTIDWITAKITLKLYFPKFVADRVQETYPDPKEMWNKVAYGNRNLQYLSSYCSGPSTSTLFKSSPFYIYKEFNSQTTSYRGLFFSTCAGVSENTFKSYLSEVGYDPKVIYYPYIGYMVTNSDLGRNGWPKGYAWGFTNTVRLIATS